MSQVGQPDFSKYQLQQRAVYQKRGYMVTINSISPNVGGAFIVLQIRNPPANTFKLVLERVILTDTVSRLCYFGAIYTGVPGDYANAQTVYPRFTGAPASAVVASYANNAAGADFAGAVAYDLIAPIGAGIPLFRENMKVVIPPNAYMRVGMGDGGSLVGDKFSAYIEWSEESYP